MRRALLARITLLSRLMLVSLALLPVLANAQGCPDIAGTYAFFGEWKGAQSKSEAPYLDSRRPSIDRDAFGFSVIQVVRPRGVRISQAAEAGLFLIDVVDPELVLPGAKNLHVELAFTCESGIWHRESQAHGGGENVPSTVTSAYWLRLLPSGEIEARGESRTVKGTIFESEIKARWNAIFPRLGGT